MGRYPLTLRSVETSESILPHTLGRYTPLLGKIKEISGIDVFRCIQCGCCAAGCPTSDYMDYTPTQWMKLLQIGCFPEIAGSRGIWACASCFACLARCPRGIDLAKVAEAVRQIHLRRGLDRQDPARIPEGTLRKLPQIAVISCFRKFSS
jgi:heterodisulfide reductase subunit C